MYSEPWKAKSNILSLLYKENNYRNKKMENWGLNLGSELKNTFLI